MSMKERLQAMSPAATVLSDIVDEVIGAHNAGSEEEQALVLALVTELTTDINAHMANATAHTNDDDVTTAIPTASVTTRAAAAARVNLIRAAYEAHRVRLLDAAEAAVHGIADATNGVSIGPVEATASWAQVDALARNVRAKYEAHRVLTTGTVHAQADATNAVAAKGAGLLHVRTLSERGDYNG